MSPLDTPRYYDETKAPARTSWSVAEVLAEHQDARIAKVLAALILLSVGNQDGAQRVLTQPDPAPPWELSRR